MWLICFQPLGYNQQLVPQMICQTEQEAKNWVLTAPYSVVGNYFYMFVPVSRPVGCFKREETYLPQPLADWQYEVMAGPPNYL